MNKPHDAAMQEAIADNIPDTADARVRFVDHVIRGENIPSDIPGGRFAVSNLVASGCVAAYPDECRTNTTDDLSVVLD
ncbi:MAG: hypothetical protein EOP06_07310 [Proteobacteria bacterium]|nr:MAG: hypothetical protein EOP06_07310 [Pseudomonadota bacterium]